MHYNPRYNTVDKDYQIIFDHGLNRNFDDVKRELDRGDEIYGDDMSFDWNLGTAVFKGRITFKKINFNIPTKISTDDNCQHVNKYINQAGGIKFWFCKDCKKDLGDA